MNDSLLKIACYRCGQRLDLSDLEPFSKVECPNCAAEITVPRWFDSSYLLEDVCGSGLIWNTYRALDVTLDREVAIKVLNPEFAEKAPGLDEIFLEKGRMMARLNHPAVIGIYHCGEYEGQSYLVMQFMPNGSLREAVDGLIPLTFGEKLKWMKQAALGLQEAQRLGVEHYDICPDVILLDSERNVRIGDFGLTAAFSNLGLYRERLDYFSPERLGGMFETYSSDVYSLGVTMYELFAGTMPFMDNDSPKEALRERSGKIDPPRAVRRDIPERLSVLIMKMLALTPADRPGYPEIVSVLEECTLFPPDCSSDTGSFWKKLFG